MKTRDELSQDLWDAAEYLIASKGPGIGAMMRVDPGVRMLYDAVEAMRVIEAPKLSIHLEHWCQCDWDGGPGSTFGSYPEDGECSISDCDTYKHHVHCGTCNKISQVG